MASACASLPTDASWGDISVIGSPAQILFAFGDKVVQVDPNSGAPVRLRDTNGDIRLDDTGKAREWLVQVNNGTASHFYTRPFQIDDQTLVALSYEDKLFEIDIPAARVDSTEGVLLPGTNQATAGTTGTGLTGSIVGNPLLTDTLIYVPLSNGPLLALNRSDYSEVWRVGTDKNKGVWSQPLLIDDTIYFASMDHHLYAVNASTGEQVWTLDLQGALASTPAYANDALYVGSLGSKIFKVTTDGQIAAEFSTQGWMWGTPAVVDDIVYAGDSGGNLYALRDTGSSLEQVWSQKIANGGIRMTPLVTGNTIIVGSRDHFVYWVDRETGNAITDAQGQTLRRDMGGEILSNMMLVNEDQAEPLVIVSSIDHNNLLRAFTLQGAELWKYPL